MVSASDPEIGCQIDAVEVQDDGRRRRSAGSEAESADA